MFPAPFGGKPADERCVHFCPHEGIGFVVGAYP